MLLEAAEPAGAGTVIALLLRPEIADTILIVSRDRVGIRNPPTTYGIFDFCIIALE